jgi:8-oxo-dGTP diphosphatase
MGKRNSTDVSRCLFRRRLSGMVREIFPLRLCLRIASHFIAPRQPIGAVGVIFDQEHRVLIVEHLLRTDFPWGLPGGWLKHGESPEQAVRREIREELGFDVKVGQLLLAEPIGCVHNSTHPRHLGLAYACSIIGGALKQSWEVVSLEWNAPQHIQRQLAPFQSKAIIVAEERVIKEANPTTAEID